jgi:hypothetical protein
MDEVINLLSPPADDGITLTVESPPRVGQFEIVGFTKFFEALQEVLPEADQIEAERIWDNCPPGQRPAREGSISISHTSW